MEQSKLDMRHISRKELVDIIQKQKERELELEQQLAAAEQKLKDRTIRIAAAGSIAEAAMDLSGVFTAAQAAADSYLESIKAQTAEMAKEIEEARSESERIIQEARKEAEQIRIDRLMQTEKEIQEKWAKFESHF